MNTFGDQIPKLAVRSSLFDCVATVLSKSTLRLLPGPMNRVIDALSGNRGRLKEIGQVANIVSFLVALSNEMVTAPMTNDIQVE